jgi:formylglycine-generating enzyme required for sulfatase activity
MPAVINQPLRVFWSYSHKDESLRDELHEHLSVLRRAGLIADWHDRKIGAGKEWKDEIDRHLGDADIVLLLISASFMASEYCWGEEMAKALSRHEQNEARVIPVMLRPCDWQETPVARLQAVPKDARPITQWADRDLAYVDVTTAIRHAVNELLDLRKPAPIPSVTTPPAKPSSYVPRPAAKVGLTALKDFEVFRDVDAPWCPEMVVIPAGEFLMGSPEKEEGRWNAEGPQDRVTIATRFAIGRYPVTVAEYRKFIEATGHRHDKGVYVLTGSNWKKDASKSWQDPGFAQTDRHPVVGVSWRDGVAYCEWLAKETGQPYRLPSEAEWEYACRAGTTTRYSWGDAITEKDANFGGHIGKTTEVGAYPANPWGLYDMHGNVWEWVEDVWHDSYEGAPADGSAWTDGEGTNSSRDRVGRGGSRDDDPGDLRSAGRSGGEPDGRDDGLGFRVARTLD